MPATRLRYGLPDGEEETPVYHSRTVVRSAAGAAQVAARLSAAYAAEHPEVTPPQPEEEPAK